MLLPGSEDELSVFVSSEDAVSSGKSTESSALLAS